MLTGISFLYYYNHKYTIKRNYYRFHIQTKKCPTNGGAVNKYSGCFYTTPCANIASATLTNPAIFAPFT